MINRSHRDQGLGILLLWIIDDRIDIRIFHRMTMLKHHNVIADLCNDCQIMRDIKSGNPCIANGLFDRGQNINLRCHIKRRCRFVKNHEIGLRTECQGRHCTLQLPTRHLMGIAIPKGFWIRKAQFFKQAYSALFRLRARTSFMFNTRFNDLLHELFRGVKGCCCRLRNIGHLSAAQIAQRPLAPLQNIASIEPDFTTCNAHTATAIGHSREPNRGFTRP